MITQTDSLSPDIFTLWMPEKGRTVHVGPENHPVPLPEVPLPVYCQDLQKGDPDADAVGLGVYGYLKEFPDCPNNREYAELLRDAYPHYIAELGSQIIMLDRKEVDAPYQRRKISYMKILALLDRDNPDFLLKIGLASFELGLTFSELDRSRGYLLSAMGFLLRSLKIFPESPTALDCLGQIDFLLGDYPSAERRWNAAANLVKDEETKSAFRRKISRLKEGAAPEHSLLDDLEAIGEAQASFGRKEFERAAEILEKLEEDGAIVRELSSPEFFHLLALSRGKIGEIAGAFEALEKALEIDPGFAPALEARESILEKGEI